jgi:AcrR family transcriptional regulator
MSNLSRGAAPVQASDQTVARKPIGRPSVRVERRGEIVEAAVEVILEHGIAGATRSRIAERAGVRPSAVHHFVGTQHAVLRAAIDHIALRLQTSLTDLGDASSDPRDDIVSMVDLVFGRAVDQPVVNQLVDELVAHSYRDAATGEALATFYRGVTDAVTEQLRHARPGADATDARAASAEIIALAHSAGTFRHLGLDELAAAAHRRARSLAEHGSDESGFAS